MFTMPIIPNETKTQNLVISKHINNVNPDQETHIRTFLFGEILYKAPQHVYNRSGVLSVLAEQRFLSEYLDNLVEAAVIKVEFPSELNNDKVIETVLNVIDNGEYYVCDVKYIDIIREINSITFYDNCISLLKFLRFHDEKKFIEEVRIHVEKVLVAETHNDKYLYDLIKSSMSDLIIPSESTSTSNKTYKIKINLQEVVKSYMENLITYDVFLKMMQRAHRDNRTDVIDITWLKLASLNFDPINIQTNYYDMSYGVMDNEFFDELRKIPDVFLSGGSLIGCASNHKYIAPVWSDIDIWITNAIGTNNDSISETENNLTRTIENVLEFLIKTFNRSGREKILWSTRKNVITLYCANYRRNIQIILMNKSPDECIKDFDLDYIRSYYYNEKIYGTVQFLLSNIQKKVTSVLDTTTPERIIKTLIKGYKFDESLKPSYKLLSNNFPTQFISNPTLQHCSCDEDIKKIIRSILNKYYFPTENEVDSFNDSDSVENRLVFLISKVSGHDNVFKSTHKLLIKIKEMLESVDGAMFFSTMYENDGEKSILKITHINDMDINKIVPFEHIDIDINHQNAMINCPFKYSFGPVELISDPHTWNKPCFVTDPIKLQWWPLKKFNKTFHRTPNSPDALAIRLWSYPDMDNEFLDKGVTKVFKLMASLDEKYKEMFENDKFKLKKFGKNPLKIKGIKFTEKVSQFKTMEQLIDFKTVEQLISNGGFTQYVKFKLWFDNTDERCGNEDRKLLTRITYLGRDVDLKQPADIHNYITIDSTVKLTILLDTIKINNRAHKRNKRAYLCPIITRIDILDMPSKNTFVVKTLDDLMSVQI